MFIYMYSISLSIYIYVYIDRLRRRDGPQAAVLRPAEERQEVLGRALLVQGYLSNAASFAFYGTTCLTRLIEFASLFATFE